MAIILISTMITISIATITNNCINIALAQPGSTLPAESGRPSPPAYPSQSTGHLSYPSSSLIPHAKQATKVNPTPAGNITASGPSHFTSSPIHSK